VDLLASPHGSLAVDRALTFLARPDLLRGIASKDEVTVKFAPTGKTLRATSIEKAGN